MSLFAIIFAAVGISDIYVIWKNHKLEKKAETLSLEVVKLNSELSQEKAYSQQLIYKLKLSQYQTESLNKENKEEE